MDTTTTPAPAASAKFSVEGLSDPSDNKRKSTSKCKVCKNRVDSSDLRITYLIKSPFKKEEGATMKVTHHVQCIFESFKRSKPQTPKITDVSLLEGFETLCEQDKESIRMQVESLNEYLANPKALKLPRRKRKQESDDDDTPSKKAKKENVHETTEIRRVEQTATTPTMMRYDTFCDLCDSVAAESKHSGKTKIISETLSSYSDEVTLVVRMLLPKLSKFVFNMKPKRIIRLFAKMFSGDEAVLLEELKQSGDASTVVGKLFGSRRAAEEEEDTLPTLYLQEVECFLEALDGLTKESQQLPLLKRQLMTGFSQERQVVYFVRLINGDLRVNAGSKHVLEGIGGKKKKTSGGAGISAYNAFCVNGDLNEAVAVATAASSSSSSASLQHLAPRLFTPIFPMLADSCKSVDAVYKKMKNSNDEDNVYVEVKYDGERVQVHADFAQDKYAFYSCSLKPVCAHKVGGLQEEIRSAFPSAETLIIDAEVLLVSRETGEPMPFGTLGKNKKEELGKTAHIRLYVFDVIHYNGVSMINKPFSERRDLLECKLTPNDHVVTSELEKIDGDREYLAILISRLLDQDKDKEGIMVKSGSKPYSPCKRHWLKIKKDYLNEGAMADSADLVVLGAWYGSGKKGGMLSSFLMCCLDKETNEWKTVTKVHTGHDDASLKRIQYELKTYMRENKDDEMEVDEEEGYVLKSNMKPDWIVRGPKLAKVWEVAGAEYTRGTGKHTANGISIRFPRIVKERDDKTWETATSMAELEELCRKSVRSNANSVDNDQ